MKRLKNSSECLTNSKVQRAAILILKHKIKATCVSLLMMIVILMNIQTKTKSSKDRDNTNKLSMFIHNKKIILVNSRITPVIHHIYMKMISIIQNILIIMITFFQRIHTMEALIHKDK